MYRILYSRVLSPRWVFFLAGGCNAPVSCRALVDILLRIFPSDFPDDISERGVSYCARRLLGVEPK